MTARSAPFPMEPLGLGESLEAGFRLWRRHFAAFFMLSVIAVVPGQLFNAWYTATNVVAVGADGEYLVLDPNTFNRNIFIISIVGLFVNAVIWGALFYFGVNAYVGRPITVGEAIRGAFNRIGPFIGLSIVYFLIVILGFILLILPGIYLAVRFALAFPAFFGEGASVGQSLGRAGDLIKKRWLRVFGLMFMAWLVTALVGAVLGSFLFFMDLTNDNIASFVYLESLFVSVVNSLFMPLIPAMLIVAYYEGRVRNEGYDIDFMASQLDTEPPDPMTDESGGGIFR